MSLALSTTIGAKWLPWVPWVVTSSCVERQKKSAEDGAGEQSSRVGKRNMDSCGPSEVYHTGQPAYSLPHPATA